MPNEVKPLGADSPSINRDRIAQRNGLGKKTGTKVYRYPETLGNDENPHYVMFFINVPESRTDAKTGGQRVRYDQTGENRIDPANNQKTVMAGASIAGVVGGFAAGASSGNTATNALSNLGAKVLTGLAGAAVGGVIGAGLGAGLLATMKVQQLVHMPISIALGIQDNPSTSYSASWQDTEMGSLGAIANGADLTVGAAGEGIRDTILGVASAPKMAGLGFDFKSYVNKAERRVRNPSKEQLFKSMGFREFAFEYNFLPRSPEEYRDVKKIIETFRQYMHPELSADKFYLLYPAEFNIIYYYKENENEHIHKVAACALKDVRVSYGGNDFTTFKGTNGMPTEIQLKLSFVELETLTSQRVAQGF